MSAQLLRSCDVILKYNSKQVLVLLVEASDEGHMIPIGRVMEAWKQEGDPGVTISFQTECLDSRTAE